MRHVCSIALLHQLVIAQISDKENEEKFANLWTQIENVLAGKDWKIAKYTKFCTYGPSEVTDQGWKNGSSSSKTGFLVFLSEYELCDQEWFTLLLDQLVNMHNFRFWSQYQAFLLYIRATVSSRGKGIGRRKRIHCKTVSFTCQECSGPTVDLSKLSFQHQESPLSRHPCHPPPCLIPNP